MVSPYIIESIETPKDSPESAKTDAVVYPR